MATERRTQRRDLQPIRRSRRRWRATRRGGAIGIVAALAAVTPAAAMIGPEPEGGRGPDVSAASFSGGELHETLTFHSAGVFFAHIVPNPLYTPKGTGPIGFKTVALGFHATGTTHISFRLGTLNAGTYAVVVLPQHQTSGPPAHKNIATWVYIAVHANGSIAVTRLIHP
jgi:hypothetical protein